MLNLTEEIFGQALKDFAETAKRLREPILNAQKIVDSFTEPIRRFEEEMREHREMFEQLSKFAISIDIPQMVSTDILKIWENENIIIDDNRKEIAEDISYALTESTEILLDEHQPRNTEMVQFRLTSNGKLFLVEDPKKNHRLSPEMEQLIRSLKKHSTSTDQLLASCGYSTKRSVSSAIHKLNTWGRGKFKLQIPIVIGLQGKGYRLSKHIHIQKIPRKELDE